MEMWIGGAGLLVIFWLAIQLRVERARLEGFQAGQTGNMGNLNGAQAGGLGQGLLRILAFIGFLSICALAFYLGVVFSGF